MEIAIRSKRDAKYFRSDSPWAAISIVTVPGSWPRLYEANRIDLLQLSFADADDVNTGMTPQVAGEILAFVDKNVDDIETLLIHCEMGVSRSPAIGAALHRIFIDEDDHHFFRRFTPNRYVYRTLLEEAKRIGKNYDLS